MVHCPHTVKFSFFYAQAELHVSVYVHCLLFSSYLAVHQEPRVLPADVLLTLDQLKRAFPSQVQHFSFAHAEFHIVTVAHSSSLFRSV